MSSQAIKQHQIKTCTIIIVTKEDKTFNPNLSSFIGEINVDDTNVIKAPKGYIRTGMRIPIARRHTKKKHRQK